MRVGVLKILDATVGFTLCWLGGYLLYVFRRTTPGAAIPATGVKRILLIRPGGMGDMILLQPMLKSLRRVYPGAEIDLVCEKRNREIPGLAGDPAGLLLYDAAPIRTLVRLLRGGYDVAIDTEQFHYFSAVMALFSRAPVRIGFKISPGRNQIYTHLVNYDLEGYEAGEFMRLLEPLGIREQARVAGCLAVSDGAGESGLILVHVGASTRYKHWANAHFVSCLQGFATSFPERIGLLGSGREVAVARAIAEQAGLGSRVEVLAGQRTLHQVAGLISRARLFVGGDSGLAHLAVALDVPTVVIFGPSDARKWGVQGERHAVVRKDRACAPCFIFGYHKFCRSIACMAEIEPEQVLDACRRVLGGGEKKPQNVE